jgi:hypothetical protein
MIDNGSWTYPGKVLVVNDRYVVFEIQDIGGLFEIYRHPDNVRVATKTDFDRQILEVSKEMVKGEEIIALLEKVQDETSA